MVRILVVEDEQIVAADLQAKLTRMRHHVVGIAASSEEALRLAEEHRPGLVLMDIQLKGSVDGVDTARLIHERTGAQIVFITAYAGVFLRDPARMLPPGICLSKPFSQYQLQTVLDAVASAPRVN